MLTEGPVILIQDRCPQTGFLKDFFERNALLAEIEATENPKRDRVGRAQPRRTNPKSAFEWCVKGRTLRTTN